MSDGDYWKITERLMRITGSRDHKDVHCEDGSLVASLPPGVSDGDYWKISGRLVVGLLNITGDYWFNTLRRCTRGRRWPSS